MVKRLVSLLALTLLLCGCGASNTAPAAENTAAAPLAPATAATGMAASGAPVSAAPAVLRADAVQVLFCNVGKADMALILAGGKAFLVDTGEKTSVAQAAAALSWAGVTRLDGVFLTHTHSDHIGGMKVLPQFVTLDAVYRASISENKEKGGNKIDEAAADAGAPLTLLSAGDTLTLTDGVTCTVLGPLAYNVDDDNDNSLVMMLSAFGRRILLTGDMQFAQEDTLLAAGADLAADVLKVGNHGNPDATGSAFGGAVSPSVAVVSTDTAEDADSNNPRVHAALPTAEMYVTEGTALGVLVTVAPDGNISVGYPQKAVPALSLTLTAADRAAQRVTVTNTGEAADVAGCFLVSERGTEVFVFPAGTVLAAGASVTVGCDDGCNHRFPDEKSVFSKKKDDAALLYDRHGNLLARLNAA